MFQKNSALQEESQSATSQFFHFPRSTDVAGDLGTFSRAIVVEAPGYLEQRAVHSALSFVVHLIAVLAIVWFGPLAFPQKPFVYAMNRQFVTLPLPLPASAARPTLSFAPKGLANPFLSVKLTAPVMKFARPMPVPPLEEILRSSPPQITAGFGAALGAILSDASRPAVVPALPLDIPPDAQVFRSGGEIKASRLVERVSFDYPEIAKIAHVFGRVVIAAVIDETGKVTQAHLVSGPGLLASSAIQALSRERFQPTLLDGQPIKCDLMVDVTFRLAGWTDDALR